MSTLEIAGQPGRAHKNVLADARRILSELDIQSAKFSADYKDARGRSQEVMNLPKRECLILVSSYSVEMRANLTPALESSAIARRKLIYEELHPETRATYEGGGFKGNQHTGDLVSDNLSFTTATADATGKDRRTVERAAARGAALGDDLDSIAGTSLDKGVKLDVLAKMTKAERSIRRPVARTSAP